MAAPRLLRLSVPSEREARHAAHQHYRPARTHRWGMLSHMQRAQAEAAIGLAQHRADVPYLLGTVLGSIATGGREVGVISV